MITVYQRRVSPHKGYSCAYRVAKNRCSCSAFGKRALFKAGLLLFMPLLLRRFRKCGRAAAALRSAKSPILDYERKPTAPRRPLYERLGCTWENCGDPTFEMSSYALAEGACVAGRCLGEAICSAI